MTAAARQQGSVTGPHYSLTAPLLGCTGLVSAHTHTYISPPSYTHMYAQRAQRLPTLGHVRRVPSRRGRLLLSVACLPVGGATFAAEQWAGAAKVAGARTEG